VAVLAVAACAAALTIAPERLSVLEVVAQDASSIRST
jgi:hypothetical protein